MYVFSFASSVVVLLSFFFRLALPSDGLVNISFLKNPLSSGIQLYGPIRLPDVFPRKAAAIRRTQYIDRIRTNWRLGWFLPS